MNECIQKTSNIKRGRKDKLSEKVNPECDENTESSAIVNWIGTLLGGLRQVRGLREASLREVGGRWEVGGPCLRAFQGGQTLGLSRVGDTGSFGTWQPPWKTPEMHCVQVFWD